MDERNEPLIDIIKKQIDEIEPYRIYHEDDNLFQRHLETHFQNCLYFLKALQEN
jgi:hypothetical protein